MTVLNKQQGIPNSKWMFWASISSVTPMLPTTMLKHKTFIMWNLRGGQNVGNPNKFCSPLITVFLGLAKKNRPVMPLEITSLNCRVNLSATINLPDVRVIFSKTVSWCHQFGNNHRSYEINYWLFFYCEATRVFTL